MEDEIVGKEFLSNSGYKFIVKCQKGLTNSRHKLFECYFPETDYTNFATKQKVKNGNIAASPSRSQKRMCQDKLSYLLKQRRRLFISRCYSPNSERFCAYGKMGVTVCERWLEDSDSFISDVANLPNVKRVLEGYEVDKDIKNFGNSKIYDLESIWFVPPEINQFYSRDKKSYLVDDEIFFATLKDLAKFLSVKPGTISQWFKGNAKPNGNYGFKKISMLNQYSGIIIDFWIKKYSDWTPPESWLKQKRQNIIESDVFI